MSESDALDRAARLLARPPEPEMPGQLPLPDQPDTAVRLTLAPLRLLRQIADRPDGIRFTRTPQANRQYRVRWTNPATGKVFEDTTFAPLLDHDLITKAPAPRRIVRVSEAGRAYLDALRPVRSHERADVIALLRSGETDRAIAGALGLDKGTVAIARAKNGIQPASMRGRLAATLAEAYEARVERLEGGHARWTGHRSSKGTPCLIFHRTRYTAYQVAFELRTGRAPQGRCKPACDMPGCVALEHVDDGATLQRDATAYAAIFGEDLAS